MSYDEAVRYMKTAPFREVKDMKKIIEEREEEKFRRENFGMSRGELKMRIATALNEAKTFSVKTSSIIPS
jgi:hypothetical protein